MVARSDQVTDAFLERLETVGPGDLIPLLQQIQDQYGYLPVDVLEDVSRRTGIPTSRMYGVITFYAQFSLTPGGRYTVRCCRGTACYVRGSRAVRDAVAGALGVGEGETGDDHRFSFETVACLGTCFLAPVMMVNDQYYGLLTPEKATSVLSTYA